MECECFVNFPENIDVLLPRLPERVIIIVY